MTSIGTTPEASIGIDVGGTKVLGVVVEPDGTVAAEARVATPVGSGALVEALGGVVEDLDAACGPSRVALPVGVGAPGLVDVRGTVRFAPNLPGVRGLDLPGGLGARLGGRPVVADNDATCAGWAEVRHGVARGAGHVLMVTLGTGIGGALVCDGRLMRGANGFSGEIGHMVVDPGGPPCPCGRSGCWERYASGSGLGRLAREAAHAGQSDRLVDLAGGDAEGVRGEHVTAAAASGDPGAVEVLRRFAGWLALGLSNLANALDPELIVIGGGLIEARELLLPPIREEFARLVEAGGERPPIRIEAAALGERAGAIGAAVLAAEAAA
ncbi:MAG TPA: ROK family protein [Acidimicrobiales bacterium]|nr:ROK family protein [Acidimicrobiales bacterium]